MSKTKTFTITIIALILLFPVIHPDRTHACTSAIIGPDASINGVPMLWKNRDTSTLSNKVIFVSEKPYSYIGLVNAKETSGRWVYAGLNSEGFGIMNTVAYNLPINHQEFKDLEGQIMADALRTCSTVDDFEEYIKKNLGGTLGSWANFGVIDGHGCSVIFEVHNNGYKKLDTNDSKSKYFINTNFSRSGEEGKGAGYLRFEQASSLFDTLKGQKVSHSFIYQDVSRSFGHPLVKHYGLKELGNRSVSQPAWLGTQDCINRPSTSGSVVITGKKPGDKSSVATMWVLLGEPVTSIAVPLWVEAKSTPLPLYEGKEAPICVEAMRIKTIIRPYKEGSKKNYMNASLLINKEKTGFLPLLLKTEREIFQQTQQFLKTKPTAVQMADFQNMMAQKALTILKTVN